MFEAGWNNASFMMLIGLLILYYLKRFHKFQYNDTQGKRSVGLQPFPCPLEVLQDTSIIYCLWIMKNLIFLSIYMMAIWNNNLELRDRIIFDSIINHFSLLLLGKFYIATVLGWSIKNTHITYCFILIFHAQIDCVLPDS